MLRRRIFAFLVLLLMIPCVLSACGDLCPKNGDASIFCGNNPPPVTDHFTCLLTSSSTGLGLIYECNVLGGPNTIPIPVKVHNHPGWCGSFYCASSLGDAKEQTGASGDPNLTCALDGTGSAWADCIGPCAACNDGQGGTLQSVGQHCGIPVDPENSTGVATCCAGLTCVGATATTMGTCQGALQCSPSVPDAGPPPDAGAHPDAGVPCASKGAVCSPAAKPGDPKACCASEPGFGALTCDIYGSPLNKCCLVTGTLCNADSDCCNSDLCEFVGNNPQKTCCREENQPCNPSSNNCCDGFDCVPDTGSMFAFCKPTP